MTSDAGQTPNCCSTKVDHTATSIALRLWMLILTDRSFNPLTETLFQFSLRSVAIYFHNKNSCSLFCGLYRRLSLVTEVVSLISIGQSEDRDKGSRGRMKGRACLWRHTPDRGQCSLADAGRWLGAAGRLSDAGKWWIFNVRQACCAVYCSWWCCYCN